MWLRWGFASSFTRLKKELSLLPWLFLSIRGCLVFLLFLEPTYIWNIPSFDLSSKIIVWWPCMAMMMMMIAHDDVLSELFFISIITLSMIIRKPDTIQNISKFKTYFAFCKVPSSNSPVSRRLQDKKGCLF